jgi:hypothetical protein
MARVILIVDGLAGVQQMCTFPTPDTVYPAIEAAERCRRAGEGDKNQGPPRDGLRAVRRPTGPGVVKGIPV